MILVGIENTSRCGADCICCPREQYAYAKMQMNQEIFESIVQQIYAFGIRSFDMGGYGDPLMDTEYERKLAYVKENYPDMRITSISTGQFLDESKADAVVKYVDDFKISNYGFTKETYEKVHRGSLNFESVRKNILEFLARKDRPHTLMAYTIFEGINDLEVEEWKCFWEKRADDITIWKPHNFAGAKMEFYDSSYDIKRAKTCGRPGRDYVFCSNGDVVACCFDFNHRLKLGNIYEETFGDIVKSDRLKEIQSIHSSGGFVGSGLVCENCDQLFERQDSLVYTSVQDFVVGDRSQTDTSFKREK